MQTSRIRTATKTIVLLGVLLIATSAYAARPLFPQEEAGLTSYCHHIFQRDFSNKPAAEPSYCKCMLDDALNIHPQTRQLIILTDAGDKAALDAYEKTLDADELKRWTDEMRVFTSDTATKCGAIVMMQ